MMDDFEDHCWKDIVTPDILEVYAIDLYELVYRGGPYPPNTIAKDYPNACGQYDR